MLGLKHTLKGHFLRPFIIVLKTLYLKRNSNNLGNSECFSVFLLILAHLTVDVTDTMVNVWQEAPLKVSDTAVTSSKISGLVLHYLRMI